MVRVAPSGLPYLRLHMRVNSEMGEWGPFDLSYGGGLLLILVALKHAIVAKYATKISNLPQGHELTDDHSACPWETI